MTIDVSATTIIKQHGALLAKGRLLGIQFNELFKENLYQTIGKDVISYADQIRLACKNDDLPFYIDNPTNQVFCIINDEQMKKLNQKVSFYYWEKYDDTHTVIRFATA